MCTDKERNLKGGERTCSRRAKKDKRHKLIEGGGTFYTHTLTHKKNKRHKREKEKKKEKEDRRRETH